MTNYKLLGIYRYFLEKKSTCSKLINCNTKIMPYYITFWSVIIVLFLNFAPAWAKKAPDFFVSNIEGKSFVSSKQQEIFIVSFFFVGCKPCIKEIPELYRLINSEFPDIPLLFIDPLKEDTRKQIARFAEYLGVPKKYFYRDPLGKIIKKFTKGKIVFPSIYGIKQQKILFCYHELNQKSIKQIRKIIKENGSSQINEKD